MKRNLFLSVVFVVSFVLTACGAPASQPAPANVISNPTPSGDPEIVLEIHIWEANDPVTGLKMVYYQASTTLCEEGEIAGYPFKVGEGSWPGATFNEFADEKIVAECGGKLMKFISDSSRTGFASSDMAVVQFMK